MAAIVSLIVLVLGSYVLAALSVHLIRYLDLRKNTSRSRHYILFARNHETRMEWFIRSIRWFSYRSGIDVRITVVDCGASEETLAIVGRFAAKDGCPVEASSLDHFREARGSFRDRGIDAGECLYRSGHAVIVDLNRREDLAKLPLF
ncbi:hypothetical protein [Paenibacillus xylaniclasticus]|uniref:hypothetical protein n=1 Tax=Paenibacillus xylaniclasticus TaxID=588083 RepID=UPI000FDAF16C|nr:MULTISPECIES: hypothetical protein [Paenibacillus]